MIEASLRVAIAITNDDGEELTVYMTQEQLQQHVVQLVNLLRKLEGCDEEPTT